MAFKVRGVYRGADRPVKTRRERVMPSSTAGNAEEIPVGFEKFRLCVLFILVLQNQYVVVRCERRSRDPSR